MELHGRPRGLFWQPAIRQDSNRAFYRSQYSDRPTVAPGRSRRIPQETVPGLARTLRIPADRHGTGLVWLVHHDAAVGRPLAVQRQAPAPASAPDMRARFSRLR